jgi:peptide/nickel transport system ATP-binding protein
MSITNEDNHVGASAPGGGTPRATALVADDLRVEAASGKPIIEDISLQLEAGTILGVVGESGSGKTTTALALLGYMQGGARIANGEVRIAGERIDIRNPKAVRKVRGQCISYVPQNPGTALNPSIRIAEAINEMIRAHRTAATDGNVAACALERVGLPTTRQFQRRYPHQLSGGQQQRVCISAALVCEPPVVVLDEPTTGLDVVTQAKILDELVRLCNEQGLAMVYVTHDLAVVAQIADRIAVMYAGSIVEQGPARQILSAPKHPYTQGLLQSIPDHLRPGDLQPMPGVAMGVADRPTGCRFAPRCAFSINDCTTAMPELSDIGSDGHQVRCLRAGDIDVSTQRPPRHTAAPEQTRSPAPVLEVSGLRTEHRGRHETVVAAADVSFTIHRGECVALVGESGSGKTTIARTIAGLHPLAAGTISLDGDPLPALARKRRLDQRRRVQIVFQNPADALNPRQTIGAAIGRPARLLRGLDKKAAATEVDRLLDLVRLPRKVAQRYPRELSGGEKQRIGIARALAADPSVIVCDEITSALDVSVQAAVLELLTDLRRDFGLALLFITHDLGVVASVADEVLVLERGRVCEQGPARKILSDPREPYTSRLLLAAPSVSHAIEQWNESAG